MNERHQITQCVEHILSDEEAHKDFVFHAAEHITGDFDSSKILQLLDHPRLLKTAVGQLPRERDFVESFLLNLEDDLEEKSSIWGALSHEKRLPQHVLARILSHLPIREEITQEIRHHLD